MLKLNCVAMRLKRLPLCIALSVILASLGGLQISAQQTGQGTANYQQQAPNPIHVKGQWYYTSYLTLSYYPSAPSATSTIVGGVGYTWAFAGQQPPSNMLIYLCNDYVQGCVDVSHSPQALNTSFNGYSSSQCASLWYFAYYIPGSGATYPLTPSYSDQLIMNYSIP